MSEKNKNIIDSVFSFSDIQGIAPKEKQDTSGKFIKTWQINKNITKETEEEEDEVQLEEEIEYEEPTIAIQEEYETYGTGEKRLTKRTFYKKPNRSDETSKVAYFEVFQYDKDNSITPSENQISYVYKPNLLGKNVVDNENSFDQIIGYRYYKSPGTNILNNNDEIITQINPNEYFIVLNNKPEHKYEIYEKDNHDCYNIIQTILQNKLTNLKDHEIYGTHQETIGFLTAMQNGDQNQNVVIKIPDYDNLWKCEIVKTSDDPEEKNIITYFNSGDTLKILNDEKLTGEQKKQALINKILMDLNFTEDEKQKGLAVIPFSVDGHSTTLIIKLKPETSRKMYIEDFSTYHLQQDNQARQNLLGKASEYCEVLNTSPIQLNGTCNFWMLAFCQVAKEYTTPDLLINDCKNGIVDIKVANKMCEFFGIKDKLFVEINKTDIEDKTGNIISKKTKCNEILIKAGSKYFSVNIDINHLQNNKNFFLDFNYFFDKLKIVDPQNSLEVKNKIIENLQKKQEVRSKITDGLGIIQENIEKYTRKLIRNNPIVLDFKKKLVELNNKLVSTNNNDYESVNELYVEIIEFENKMSNFPKEKKELYERYKTLLEETKIEEDFDIKKLITSIDNNSIKYNDQRIKNLEAKLETSFKEKLAELRKVKSEDNIDNYRIKKIYDKRAENLATLIEKESLTEIEQVQRELLQEQLRPRNERDDLKIKMLFKKLEAIISLDIAKENVPNGEKFNVYSKYAEKINEELEDLNLELDIRDTNIKSCIEPNNEYVKIYLKELKDRKDKSICKNMGLDEKGLSGLIEGSKLIVKDKRITLLRNQEMLWDLENKFNEERFVDNRREHEKSEIIIQPKETLKKLSSQSPLSFVQKENLRKQQRKKSSSAPAKLGR